MAKQNYESTSDHTSGPTSEHTQNPKGNGSSAISEISHTSEQGPGPTQKAINRAEMLNRSESAIALGISKSEFIRRESLGMYVPTYINEKGWNFFSIDYLSTLPGYGAAKNTGKRMSSDMKATQAKESFLRRGPSSAYEPAVAAKVFQELDKGTETGEIVVKLLVHPDTVASIYEAWARLKTMKAGGILISAKAMEAISNLPLMGDWPATNEEQFVANMKEISQSTPMCPKCTKRPSRICMTCAEPEIEMPTLPTAPKMGRPRKTG